MKKYALPYFLLLVCAGTAFAVPAVEPPQECGRRMELPEKPESCPCCGFSPVAAIMWGLPVFNENLEKALASGYITLGGCMVSDDDPSWECSSCKQLFWDSRRTAPGNGSGHPAVVFEPAPPEE